MHCYRASSAGASARVRACVCVWGGSGNGNRRIAPLFHCEHCRQVSAWALRSFVCRLKYQKITVWTLYIFKTCAYLSLVPNEMVKIRYRTMGYIFYKRFCHFITRRRQFAWADPGICEGGGGLPFPSSPPLLSLSFVPPLPLEVKPI